MTITVHRKKRENLSFAQRFIKAAEDWLAYFRENPHRFITEYLGLKLYDFQKILIYDMNKFSNFIYVASRGLAKSTIALLFAIQRCILYPETVVVIVAPTKSQSGRFIAKVRDFMRDSPNLAKEIEPNGIRTSQIESSITFINGSKIFSVPYSENALGIRCNILIVDEFVRTEREIILRVFVPFLTNVRSPKFYDLSNEERKLIPPEPNKQVYLSSIRRADEWSYKYFEQYVDYMTSGNDNYMTVALPYNFGVKNGFISRQIVEQSFKESAESKELLLAEYLCLPERGMGNSFYTFANLTKRREETRALVCMSNEDYVQYKDNLSKWPYYVEKLPNEKRILAMDVALVESKANDNTAIWIIRCIPDGGKYKKIFSYAESLHGINSLIQARRAKQLFYEFNCDYFALDAQGVGMGIADICSTETYDEARGIMYPAWGIINQDEMKVTSSRAVSMNAVPVIYGIKTSIAQKSQMLLRSRDLLDTNEISLLFDSQEAVENFNKLYKYYKIDDIELRTRMLNPFVQTTVFINEAINLEQTVVQGYFSVKEKSGRRKDRVMSLIYGLSVVDILESQLAKPMEVNFLDYVFSM